MILLSSMFRWGGTTIWTRRVLPAETFTVCENCTAWYIYLILHIVQYLYVADARIIKELIMYREMKESLCVLISYEFTILFLILGVWNLKFSCIAIVYRDHMSFGYDNWGEYIGILWLCLRLFSSMWHNMKYTEK